MFAGGCLGFDVLHLYSLAVAASFCFFAWSPSPLHYHLHHLVSPSGIILFLFLFHFLIVLLSLLSLPHHQSSSSFSFTSSLFFKSRLICGASHSLGYLGRDQSRFICFKERRRHQVLYVHHPLSSPSSDFVIRSLFIILRPRYSLSSSCAFRLHSSFCLALQSPVITRLCELRRRLVLCPFSPLLPHTPCVVDRRQYS